MKKIILFALIAITCSSCLNTLEDEGVYATITYKGRLVDKSSLQPISGMVVQITDGITVQSQATTTEEGRFQLEVVLTDITDDYYILLSGHNDYSPKKGKLVGFGKKEYDYKDLLLNNNTLLPTFQHNGVTYFVHPDLGSAMTWSQAWDACNNLTYNDYSDWILPTQEVLNTMYIHKDAIGGFLNAAYWSSTTWYGSYYEYAYIQDFEDGRQFSYSVGGSSNLFRVRCVRKEE